MKNQEKRLKPNSNYKSEAVEEAFDSYLQQIDASYFRAFNPKELFLEILKKKQYAIQQRHRQRA